LHDTALLWVYIDGRVRLIEIAGLNGGIKGRGLATMFNCFPNLRAASSATEVDGPHRTHMPTAGYSGIPYSQVSLRFKSDIYERQFQEEWIPQRIFRDRTVLGFVLSSLAVGTLLQIVLTFCNKGVLGADAGNSCPEMMVTSWIGGLSHIAVVLLCGRVYHKHRTLIVAIARIYSAITTAVVLPGCAVQAIHKSHRPETFASAALLRTGVISTLFQAVGFPVPFSIHAPLVLAAVLLHMIMLATPLCTDQAFLTANMAWIEWIAYYGKSLHATVYGALSPPGLLPNTEDVGPVSCVQAICFMQASLAAVVPLFFQYCYEARRRYDWYHSLVYSRRHPGNFGLHQVQQGESAEGQYLPPTMLELLVALTVLAVVWGLLGLV
jgi:hypothetical protein